jgi:hypothetical protein
VTGDAKSGITENIVAIDEDASIRAYLPLTDFERWTGRFGQDAFAYEADQGRFIYPEGHPLARERVKVTEDVIVYRTDPTIRMSAPSSPGAARGVSEL